MSTEGDGLTGGGGEVGQSCSFGLQKGKNGQSGSYSQVLIGSMGIQEGFVEELAVLGGLGVAVDRKADG